MNGGESGMRPKARLVPHQRYSCFFFDEVVRVAQGKLRGFSALSFSMLLTRSGHPNTNGLADFFLEREGN